MATHAVKTPFNVRKFGVELELALIDFEDWGKELFEDGTYITKALAHVGYSYYSDSKTKSVKGGDWRLSLEDDPGSLVELASPLLYTWKDLEKVVAMSTELAGTGKMYWSGSDCTHCSMHITVNGECLGSRKKGVPALEDDVLGILNFLAVWEALYPLLQKDFAKRSAVFEFGGPMRVKVALYGLPQFLLT